MNRDLQHKNEAAFRDSIVFVSRLHRSYKATHKLGDWFCCTDLDAWAVIEWGRGYEPAGLVEYKDDRWIDTEKSEESLRPLIRLARGYRQAPLYPRGLPFFRVQYTKAAQFEDVIFTVVPKNEVARQMIPKPMQYDYEQYGEFLRRLRTGLIPEHGSAVDE